MWESHTIKELTQEFYDYISKEKGIVFIAMADGCAVGGAQCGLRRDYVEGTDPSPVGYLEGIFIKREYRYLFSDTTYITEPIAEMGTSGKNTYHYMKLYTDTIVFRKR